MEDLFDVLNLQIDQQTLEYFHNEEKRWGSGGPGIIKPSLNDDRNRPGCEIQFEQNRDLEVCQGPDGLCYTRENSLGNDRNRLGIS